MSSTASKNAKPVIAVTSGEPSGIGPDICLHLAKREWNTRLVVLGDRELFATRAASLGLDPGLIELHHVPLRQPSFPGKLDTANAAYVLELLDLALPYPYSGAGRRSTGRLIMHLICLLSIPAPLAA